MQTEQVKSGGKGKSKDVKGQRAGKHKWTCQWFQEFGLELPKTVRFEEPILETHETPQMYHTDSTSTDTPWLNYGWIFYAWNKDWSSVGCHDGWSESYDNSAASLTLFLGSLDLGAVSNQKSGFEWGKMDLYTCVAVNTFPLSVGPGGAGDGRLCRTASGECSLDGGAWQCQGFDESGWCAQSVLQCARNCTQWLSLFSGDPTVVA